VRRLLPGPIGSSNARHPSRSRLIGSKGSSPMALTAPRRICGPCFRGRVSASACATRSTSCRRNLRRSLRQCASRSARSSTPCSRGSRSNGTKNVDPLEGVVFTPHTRERVPSCGDESRRSFTPHVEAAGLDAARPDPWGRHTSHTDSRARTAQARDAPDPPPAPASPPYEVDRGLLGSCTCILRIMQSPKKQGRYPHFTTV
jgi:hypothetical protein